MLPSHVIDGSGSFIGVAVPIDRSHHAASDDRLEKPDPAGWPPLRKVHRRAPRPAGDNRCRPDLARSSRHARPTAGKDR